MESLEPPVAVAPPPAAPAGIFPAHLLFLISLVLAVILGTAVQVWLLWPGMILTEVFLLLLPALLFAVLTGLPIEALRLKWVGAGACWMGMAIGAGILPLALGADLLGGRILGYSWSLPEDFWAKGPVATLFYVLAIAVCAPFCEELLFRGYILGAYERAGWRPRQAILAVAALFTAYHLSPSRAPGVAVAALALTYVAWRTGSVWPSIGVHAGANGTVALLVATGHSQWVDEPSPRGLLLASIPGLLATAICLWRIATGPPRAQDAEFAPVSAKFRQWWPLWVAGAIVLVVASLEVRMYKFSPAHATHTSRVEEWVLVRRS